MNVSISLSAEALSVAIDALAATPEPADRDGAMVRSQALHRMLDAYSRTQANAAPRDFTKWDVLHPIERAALDAMPFGDGTCGCSKCGTVLPTEGAFARHYVVSDRRYLNLGYCAGMSSGQPGEAGLSEDTTAL